MIRTLRGGRSPGVAVPRLHVRWAFAVVEEPVAVFCEGFAAQFTEFLDAIAEGREASVSGVEGRAAIEMVQAAEQSARSGASVALPLAGVGTGASGARA